MVHWTVATPTTVRRAGEHNRSPRTVLALRVEVIPSGSDAEPDQYRSSL